MLRSSFAVVQCVSIVVVVAVAEIALAVISTATAAVDDLVIVAAAVVCIVVVVDAGRAAVGAATAAATCAVTYARLWFDSYGGRHMVVSSVVEVVRGGRSGGENLVAAAVGRSVQRRPQLDRGVRDRFIDFGRDVQRFHRVAGRRDGGTRIVGSISTVYGTTG